MTRSEGVVYLGKTRDELITLCDHLQEPTFTKGALSAEQKKGSYKVKGKLGFYPQHGAEKTFFGILVKRTMRYWFVVDARNPQWNINEINHIRGVITSKPETKTMAVLSVVDYKKILSMPPSLTNAFF